MDLQNFGYLDFMQSVTGEANWGKAIPLFGMMHFIHLSSRPQWCRGIVDMSTALDMDPQIVKEILGSQKAVPLPKLPTLPLFNIDSMFLLSF